MEAPSLSPSVSPEERIEFLDLLRGLALFGILAVNLPFLGLPLSESEGGPTFFDASGAEPLVATLIRALAENKFMALFSLLFGMGLALQLERAERQGRDPSSFYPRRLVVLALFGVVNGTLLFYGDILLPYAVAGTVLYLLRKRSDRTLLVLAGVLLTIGISLSVVFEGLWNDTSSNEELELLDDWLKNGSFLVGTGARAMIYVAWLVASSLIAFNWRILALFLVGCVAMRRGWTKPEAAAQQRMLVAVGLSIGLVLEGNSIALHGRPGASTAELATDVLAHQIGGLFLAAGYAGLVARWSASRFTRRLRSWIANAGRMALTNYLGQSFVAGLLFYGHGAGLLGEFSRLQLLGLTVAIFAAQIAFSTLWLKRFRSGPLEHLWRRLTHGARRAPA